MNLDHEDNLDDLPEACSEEGYDDEQEESEDSGPESEITEDRNFLKQTLTTQYINFKDFICSQKQIFYYS